MEIDDDIYQNMKELLEVYNRQMKAQEEIDEIRKERDRLNDSMVLLLKGRINVLEFAMKNLVHSIKNPSSGYVDPSKDPEIITAIDHIEKLLGEDE